MNRPDLTLPSVYHSRPYRQQNLPSEGTITPLQVRLAHDRSPSHSTSSSTLSEETVIPWHTPPAACPTPPNRSIETLRAPEFYPPFIGANEAANRSDSPLVVRFDEDQIRKTEIAANKRGGRMDTNDTDSSSPTPNIDDTPYIRFAIDQLTRDQDIKAVRNTDSSSSSSEYPVDRIVPDYGLGYMSAEREREALALIRKHRSSPGEGRLFAFNATRALSEHSAASDESLPLRQKQVSVANGEAFIPVPPPVATKYPDLTFVPTILRPVSMVMLSCLCLLMMTALIFCAVFSITHHGLVDWYGGIYGWRYFVFSFLPQMLAAVIFIYVQSVMIAVTRMTPFTMMAMDDVRMRANALFLDIFPKSMLWPRWEGPVMIDVANTFLWLSVFIIPLQSCLFSVIQVDGNWKWATVQGIAWTLVALYILILVGVIWVAVFFFRRTTGLMWDPRSLADIIALLPRSNALGNYPGTDILRNKEEIRRKLGPRTDRLGYWRTGNEMMGMFYCIGEEGIASARPRVQGRKSQVESSDMEQGGSLYDPTIRYRYIPWYLKDTFVIFWCVAGFFLLLALFIVSFLPSTAIRNGFDPLISALPNSAAYSSANFIYSFIPSTIGMLLFLFFQPLDMSIRQLQPWAELSTTNGVIADQSLLLDYPFLLPVFCTIKALRQGHYRIAALSLLSAVFLLLPILAGGLFFPLSVLPSLEVKMIPNLPSFYIILTLLILYFLALLSLIPGRRQLMMPHATDCLAEILSFVGNSRMLEDAAFRAPRSREDLSGRLSVIRVGGGQHRWGFGVGRGRDGGLCLGVERVGRERRVSSGTGLMGGRY